MDKLKDYNGREHIGKGVRYDVTGCDGQPSWFKAAVAFSTPNEAHTFAAQFAKYIKVRVIECHTYSRVDGVMTADYSIWNVCLDITLHSNRINQGVNEAGLKRIKSFMTACKQLGVQITRTRCTSSIDIPEVE